MEIFNIEAAKRGAAVCTRDGQPVEIVKYDARHEHYHIVALIDRGEYQEPHSFCDDGRNRYGADTDWDLMMAGTRREGWVNVYRERLTQRTSSRLTGADIFDSYELAKENIIDNEMYITTVKIDWYE